jgi:hypothetical protein
MLLLFGSIWVRIRGLALGRQMFYHLSHASSAQNIFILDFFFLSFYSLINSTLKLVTTAYILDNKYVFLIFLIMQDHCIATHSGHVIKPVASTNLVCSQFIVTVPKHQKEKLNTKCVLFYLSYLTKMCLGYLLHRKPKT